MGLTHALRGNSTGATTVLTRGVDHLSGYAQEPPYAIDVTGLLDWATSMVSRLDQTPTDVGPPIVLRLRTT